VYVEHKPLYFCKVPAQVRCLWIFPLYGSFVLLPLSYFLLLLEYLEKGSAEQGEPPGICYLNAEAAGASDFFPILLFLASAKTDEL